MKYETDYLMITLNNLSKIGNIIVRLKEVHNKEVISFNYDTVNSKFLLSNVNNSVEAFYDYYDSLIDVIELNNMNKRGN